ncbi:hypothetical protein J1N35_012894 [Gossypium stocksii]|uniref:Ubiquitin-like protease family profile domain-containing protein n=1 Tax=Gossypium stocksii TaxID=47602 RepID=A0A9D4A667_9ROSI|nr:hypothetical protein J1N35_012894 [Gossypium stocksii]
MYVSTTDRPITDYFLKDMVTEGGAWNTKAFKERLSEEVFKRIANNDCLPIENVRMGIGQNMSCLVCHHEIEGYKECPMFFLSAWKPKVEQEHLNFNSSNDKFGQGFNPYPSPLPPLQPFPEVEGTEKAISNIPTSSDTARPLKIAEEIEDVDAVEINGVNVQRGVAPNFPSPIPIHSSIKVVAAPSNTLEGPHNQIVSNGNPEIGKANKEKVPRTKRRNLRTKIGEGNKEKLPKTTQTRLTSAVWKDFVKCVDVVTGNEKSRCTHCSTELTRKKKRGTKHMKNHLIYHCPVMKIQNQERRRLNFVKMIIKHRYPLDMADQEFFKNFVKDMQPMFEFESKDISSYIRSIYKEEKEKLQLYFDKLASKFNLTVSLWKNNSGKTAYCCLIARFIDDSWELKMKTLGLRTLEHINDTKAIGGIIQSLVSEWNIGSKVCSITVDNSFLDDSMVQQIKEDCLSNLVSLSSTHWFINCTLLEDGFREMDDLLFNLKKSIEYVTETKHGRLKFQEAVDQVNLQDGKSWDDLSFKLESDFDILDSALRSREIFCKLEQIDGNFKLNPSMEEWENAAALQSCLRCFDDIKGIQSITVSLYFPKLCDIYKKFLQLEKSNPSFVTLMKRRFDHYWRLCNSALTVASVLDPRLKFKFVEFSYILIYGHDSKEQLNSFREVLTSVYNEYANETKNQTTSASVLDDINWLGNNSIWDSFSKFVTASNFNEASSKSELELYLDEPLLPKDGAIFDILGWWCDKSQKFPILTKMARDFLAIPVSIFSPCSNIKATINNPAYSILNPESMEALVCNENWLETPKGNDGENHEPMQITDKGKRKMDEEDSYPVKNSKPSNCEKVNSTEDIAKDSNNNDFSLSFDNWMELQFSSSEYIGEKAEIMKALVCNENRLESSMGKPNHEKNIDDVTEILNYDPLFNIYQLDEVQSSSSESEDDTTLKEEGPWCEQDIKAYLLSRFTSKEHKRLDKWQRNELNGKLIGRDKKFKFQGEILAPLLMMPQSDETRKKYYINDSVVNAFFELLKKRSDTFPNTYINHYSFDSQIAAQLIQGSRSEHEVLIWFKAEKLRGVHILFLPLCLSSHWVLLYVDIKEKKFSLLDPDPSSLILSYHLENHVKVLLQWFTSFLLPKHGYSDANKWPFIVRNDIPKQKNLVDCGIFVMKYGDCLTHGDCFPFKQEDMVHFRRRIFLDIYRGRLYRKKNKQ